MPLKSDKNIPQDKPLKFETYHRDARGYRIKQDEILLIVKKAYHAIYKPEMGEQVFSLPSFR